jgi:hypothetical protein
MSLGLCVSVALKLTCKICGNARDEELAAATDVEVRLFGALPYAVCPGCRIPVGSLIADRDYRTKARVRHFTNTGRVWPLEAADQR